MRLTVGPLPSAVYWRRRAVVLGALVLVVAVFYASCSGSADGRKNTAATPTPEPVATGPEPESSQTLLTPEPGGPPEVEAEPGDEAEPTGGAAATDAAPPPQPPAPVAGPCTDEEMTITPVPAKATIKVKSPVDIRLKIQNSGDRSCGRDVGADLQELRIVKGAETIWSSDHCGPARGSDMRTLAVGAVREYMVTWNGKSSTRCSAGAPVGPAPAAGQYHLLARLGTKHSTPVVLTLR